MTYRRGPFLRIFELETFAKVGWAMRIVGRPSLPRRIWSSSRFARSTSAFGNGGVEWRAASRALLNQWRRLFAHIANASRALSGLLKRYPCASSQFWSRRKASCDSVSTPSAIVRSASERAMRMMVLTMVRSSSSSDRSLTNDLSIFSLSTRKRFRYERLEYPVPNRRLRA